MNNVFGINNNPAIPTTYYLGLSSTLPTIGGTNVTEPSTGAGYGRLSINNLFASLNGLVTNVNVFNFSMSSTNWGVIPYYVIYDSVSGGHLLMFGNLSSPINVQSLVVVNIQPGELDIQLSSVT